MWLSVSIMRIGAEIQIREQVSGKAGDGDEEGQ